MNQTTRLDMESRAISAKRRRLDTLVNNICLNKIIEEKYGNKVTHDEESSTHYKVSVGAYSNVTNNIITVQPQAPDRRTKVYVLRRSSQLTSGRQLQCSKCNALVFKLHRVPIVSRSNSSNHSDMKTQQVCRRCFSSQRGKDTDVAVKLHYQSQSRDPLGITCNRTTDVWRMIRRGMIKRCSHTTVACPIVTIVKGHVDERKSTTYCAHDGHIIQNGDVPDYLLQIQNRMETAKDTTTAIDNHLAVQDCAINPICIRSTSEFSVDLDHDYMNNVQSDVTIDNKGNTLKRPLPIHPKAELFTAVKQTAMVEKKPNLPITLKYTKINQEKKSTTNPKIATKPQQQSEDINRQGINCPVCNRVILKSYSCWRKLNTPEQFHYLFRNDAEVIRACRKCIPYKKPKHVQVVLKGVPIKDEKQKLKDKVMKGKEKKNSNLQLESMNKHVQAVLRDAPIKNEKQKLKDKVLKGKEKKNSNLQLESMNKHVQAVLKDAPITDEKHKLKEKVSKAKEKKINNLQHESIASTLSSKVVAGLRSKFAKSIIRRKAIEMALAREGKINESGKTETSSNNQPGIAEFRTKNESSHKKMVQQPQRANCLAPTKYLTKKVDVKALLDSKCINFTNKGYNINNLNSNNNNNDNIKMGTNQEASSSKFTPTRSRLYDDTDTFDAESITLQTGLKSLRSGKIVIFNLDKDKSIANGNTANSHNHSAFADCSDIKTGLQKVK